MSERIVEGYRLSPQQRRLWLLQQSHSPRAFTSQCVVLIDGRLNRARLATAVTAVAHRHEILRTVIERVPGVELPLQVITETRISIENEHDLRGLDGLRQEEEIERLLVQARRSLAADSEANLHISLAQMGDERHALILTLPAYCNDAAGMNQLVRELNQHYAAVLPVAGGAVEHRGTGLNGDEPPQYADLSEWQNELLESSETEAGRRRWRQPELSERLDVRLPFELSAVAADAPRQSFSPDLFISKLDVATSVRVRETAKCRGVSEAAFWLACWEALIWRLTGEDEFVVGTGFDGRHQEGLEHAVGPLTRYLPLRARLEGELRFDELMESIEQQLGEAREWQEYFSWELITGASNDGGGDETKFCAACFDFSNTTETRTRAGGTSFSLFEQYACLDCFKVKLSCHRRGNSLRLELHYDQNVYSATSIERLAGHLKCLANSALRTPETQIIDLDVMTEEERRRLLSDNSPARPLPPPHCLHELFTEQAARSPHATALTSGAERMSYAELDRRSSLLARRLRRWGVGAESLVALLCEPSCELIVAMLGILKAGGAYLPIDVRHPPERVRAVLEDSGARVLLTAAEQAERLMVYPERVLCLDTEWEQVEAEAGDGAGADEGEGRVSPSDLAYVIYTSGSTGRPKGVMVTHANVCGLLAATRNEFSFTGEDVWTLFHSPAFDFSVWEVWGSLLTGGRLVVVPYLVGRDAEAFRGLLVEEGVTVLNQTPSAFRQLMRVEEEARAEGGGELKLRLVIFGGEALDVQSLRPWYAGHEEERPRLVNMYGITETTVHVTSRGLRAADAESARGSVIGCALRGWRLYLLDRRGRPVPEGVAGELCVGGAGVSRGYLNRPDLTAERFVPDPYSREPGVRVYRSGDLARQLPDWELEYLGRIDQQVKIRGFRIEPGEIEVVLRGHPAVREAVVVARGEAGGGTRLVAYVVSAGSAATSDIRNHLRERLPEYMVPSAFVFLDRLPLTPNGKLDRRALPEPTPTTGGEYTAPRTPVEEVVAGVWAEVLGLERVGLRENFFELGGHSLLATQVISRLREALGVEVGLRALFESPTIEGLGSEIEQALLSGREPAPPIARADRSVELPLSFAQQRLWFLHQLEPESAAYNIPLTVRLSGRLDVNALGRSLTEIVRRHEVLRTTFATVDGRPVQTIAEAGPVPLPVTDLWKLPEEEREAEMLRLASEEAERPFDLARGPLFRVRLLRLGEEEHALLYTKHHIVSDGWSTAVLVRELGALYAAYTRGEESPLAELPVQYADFAQWQRRWLTGDVLEAQLSHWREQLSGAPAVLGLPTDRPRPPVPTYRGAVIEGSLPAELSGQLKELSRREGATLYMVLLAAFQALLHKYAGQEDVVVGTPIAGRTRPEVEHLIGFFINVLVMRARVSEGQTFLELLRQVRETALAAYANQDVPFERLVEELQPERSLGHTPLFQVVFSMQNAPWRPLTLPGITLTTLPAANETSKFDLVLNMWDSGSNITTSLRYNTDLFDAATVARLLGHLENLLRGVAANPSQRLSDIPLLTREERERLLLESHGGEADYKTRECVQHLFEAQVERTPGAVALVFGARRLSYDELNRRANQVAHHLLSLGVGRGAAVGLYLEHSVEMVAALLGVLKAGAAYVPLEPSHPAVRTDFMISDAGISLLLAHAHLTDGLKKDGVTVVPLDADFQAVSQQSDENPARLATAGDLAYIIYTSGSTGRPKGVMVEHASLVNYVSWAKDVYLRGESLDFPLYSSLAFDLTVTSIFAPLIAGGRILIYDKSGSDYPLTRVLDDDAIDVLKLTPSHLTLVEGRDNSRSRLKCLIVGGEALETTLARRIHKSFGGRVEIINEYGPTEATVGCMIHRFNPARDERAAVPIGVPATNQQIYVLDSDLHPVAENVVGELYVGGAGVTRGYLNRPALTAARFVPDPFSAEGGARLYRTGDLARRLASGAVEFLGRADDQVKVRGHRVELGELRAALNRHPRVRDSVMVLRRDAEGRPLLAAYYVARQEVGAGELRQFLLGEVAAEVVPEAYVHLRRLPLTLNGKVNYAALPEAVRGEGGVRSEGAGVEGPRTPVEEVVCGVWAEVLGAERVGVGENFFELGGHSLLATQVISRLREALGVELPLRTLFEAPTVAKLAERIGAVLQVEGGTKGAKLVKASGEAERPLSFAQQRLWFLQQLEPDSYLYNIPVALQLKGPLDVVAIERSIGEVVRRHEALRTSFPSDGGQPRQRIAPPEGLRLEVADLSHLPRAARETELQRAADEEARRPFDLARGPLYRVRLLRLGQEEHALLYTMHHIVSDGWSLGVLLKEVSALYRAYTRGEESPLAELPIQYGDYAVWQREWLQGEVLEAQLAYWREQLAGAPPALDLPTARPRPPVQTTRGAHVNLRLPLELMRRLKEASREQGATLFMTLLAGFAALLQRYTGQDDVVVGTPVAGRGRSETEGLIGFFVNTLVLRTDLGGDPSFGELVERVRQMCLEAYAHQDVPFERLVEELQPVRDMSRPPLFQVVFMFTAGGREVVTLEGLELETLSVGREAAKCDLTLELHETEEEIAGAIVYNTDLFERETVERLCVHYVRLLEGATTTPTSRLSALDLLTEEERERVLGGAHLPPVLLPAPRCLHELFTEQAARSPHATALTSGAERMSYAELDRRSALLARRLRRWGVGAESLVALLCEPSCELIVAMLGILKAGGAYLPIDVRHPPERVRAVLEDSGARVLLTAAEQAERLVVYPERVLCLDTEWEQLEAEAGDGADVDEGEGRVSPSDLCYVIYTSGSTGRPKGVMVTHANVCGLLAATRHEFSFTGEDVWTLFHSPAFDFSVWEVWGSLLTGGRLVVVPYLVGRDAEAFRGLLVEEGVTVLNQTPSAFRQLMRVEEEARTAGSDGEGLASLRLVIFGGEALDVQSLRPWYAGHEEERPRLVNMYGITETTVHVTARGLRAADAEAARGSVIGEAIPGWRAYVLDSRLCPAPYGVPGELCVGGVGLARGYLNRPDLTAERFVPDPFSTESGARLYRSGDLARRLPGGGLEYLGRIDRQVKVRGFRIEPGEIEAALAALPGVREAVVMARQDAPGETRLVAYLVAHESHTLTSLSLRKLLRECLPEYMVPSAFVFLDRLPLTPNGKLDRSALPEPGREDAKGMERVLPRTMVEEVVAGVWAEVLGVERVGVGENFFELGGHSLLATQVVSRLREALGVEVGLRALFESPTVEGLAREVERALASGREVAPPIARAERSEEVPLSFAQQRLWFLHQLEPESAVYNVFGTVRLDGRLDNDALERSLSEVMRRHEVLRTTFPVVDGQPVQHVNPHEGFRQKVADLGQLPEGERETEVRRVAVEEARRPFDLERGPLCRVLLLRLSDEDHVLLYTMHHIVSDGWSMGVLLKEISVLYGAFSAGKESPLEELPIQYADYAVWQREWLQGEVLEEQLSYWRRQLAEAPPALDLPTDRPRPPVQTYRGASVSVHLPAELSGQLKELSRREGATLYMVLLAAFQALLHKYAGQEDVVVGTPIAGRTRPEVEHLIGFFINTLVLRADLSGDPTFGELVARVRRVCLEAYAHQDVPFERLVEELQPVRDMSRTPFFQVMFVLQNAPVSAFEMSELGLKPVQVEAETAKFDLILAVEEEGDTLVGKLVYNTDLFERETAERLCRRYAALLAAVTADTSAPLSHLPLLLPGERDRLLALARGPRQSFPLDQTLHALLSERLTLEEEAMEDGERVPIWRPIAQASGYVLDGGMGLVGEGVVGELYVGGGVARGYVGRPALTAEQFVPDPFAGVDDEGGEGGGRLYRTGDLVRWNGRGEVEFVGKVDRHGLPPTPVEGGAVQGESYVAPRTSIERMLADMWAEVLNLGRVGVDDNFFDLGGHSLIMVQLHNKLREALNRKVSIIDMFKYPTISALAAHLGGEEAGESEQGPSDERVESRKTSRRRQRARRQGGK